MKTGNLVKSYLSIRTFENFKTCVAGLTNIDHVIFFLQKSIDLPKAYSTDLGDIKSQINRFCCFPILYVLKASENIWFCGLFGGWGCCELETLARNGLK